MPWSDDLDHLVLGPLKSRGGQAPGLFEDVAMIHKRSKTLLVTDIIQTAPSEIPEIVLQDPVLCYSMRETMRSTKWRIRLRCGSVGGSG